MESLTFKNELFPRADKRALESKTAIIESFMSLVERRGPFRLTFEDIGRPCGKSRSQVRYHFQDIESILLAAFKYSSFHGRHFTVERINKATSPYEKLDAFINGAFDWAKHDRKQVRIHLMASSMLEADGAIYREYLETKNIGLKRVEEIVAIICQHHEVQVCEEKKLSVAYGIYKLLTGSIIDFFQRSDVLDCEDLRTQTIKNARVVINRLLYS